MKKLRLGLLVGGALLFAGCANFVTGFGVPSISVAGGGSTVTFDTSSGLYKYTFKVVAQQLPGSPAATIAGFVLDSGGELGGTFVNACPNQPQTTAECRYEIDFSGQAAVLPTYTITAYRANSQNINTRTVQLPSPVRVFP